jgi:hypothetical protein
MIWELFCGYLLWWYWIEHVLREIGRKIVSVDLHKSILDGK